MEVPNHMHFIALFEDGTMIQQDASDSSRLGGVNAYSDVLIHQNTSRLISFVLKDDQVAYGVDLRDGHFEINRHQFFLHRHDQIKLKDFRLYYFRNVRQHQTIDEHGTEYSHDLAYTIGFEATDAKGKNHVHHIKTVPKSG